MLDVRLWGAAVPFRPRGGCSSCWPGKGPFSKNLGAAGLDGDTVGQRQHVSEAVRGQEGGGPVSPDHSQDLSPALFEGRYWRPGETFASPAIDLSSGSTGLEEEEGLGFGERNWFKAPLRPACASLQLLPEHL